MNKGVDSQLYNTLVEVARNAARLELKVDDTLTDGLRAVAQTKDLDTFDRTYDLFTENMRKRNEAVPVVIEQMRVVVHEADAKGVPISDENGVPRPFSELKAATATVTKKRRGRPPKRTQH